MPSERLSSVRSQIASSRKSSPAILLLLTAVLFLILPQTVRAQTPPCPAGGVSGEHTFHSVGEVLNIPIALEPCQTAEVLISWANGLNNGSNLKVSFIDASNKVIYYEQGISAFLTGSRQFPLSPPLPYPWRGSRSELFNPATLRIETVTPFGDPCTINYAITIGSRPGYNVGGDSFGNAPLVTSFPVIYKGSAYDGFNQTPGGSSDPGQFFRVRLKCKQAMYIYGSVTHHQSASSHFRVDLYNANATPQVIISNWASYGSVGTANFVSTPYLNPNSTDTDYYIRVWSDSGPIHNFELNIDEYVASNNVNNPRPVAPDATGSSGSSVSMDEYHFSPALPDMNDVLTGRETELWAKLYWPTVLSGGPYPLVVFLHGNHNTCGRALTSPRLDDDNTYTFSGTCGTSPFFMHGTSGTPRNDLAGWFGMRITTGAVPLLVRSLARMFQTGNSGNHTLRIVRVSDNVEMASVSLSMIGGSNNSMKYQTLASPVTLAANTSYYIVSQESVGGDLWYDSNATMVGTGAATVNGSAFSPDGAIWTVGGTPGQSYGLVDFEYDFTNATGRSIVPNHLGYEYLATDLASRGYIVASINANRGITGILNDPSYLDDPSHIFSRGRLVLKHLETLRNWNSGGSPLIVPTSLGTLRRNSNNWFGMKITVGSKPLTVYSLGRIFVSGNTGTHTVKIVQASNGTNVPNGSVNISMSGGTAGKFKYANLATPVTLAANTSYYIASKEQKNGDYWHDSNTVVSSSSIATVNGRVTSTNGSNWDASGGVLNNVYIPVDFKYQILNVNLTGKVDLANVGLMGHSRGGQGVRAAYNLYRTPGIDPRDPDIDWPTKVPGMNIKGIFEIGPTDFFLPTSNNGIGSQYLNADGRPFNVLLPMCDGDVSNLQGVRVFDRIMSFTGNNGVPNDNLPTQKSTYTVWGANHNFYNTEWQDSESEGCRGLGNDRIFPLPVTNGDGSPVQRTTGSASVLAFFRANVGAAPDTSFNQNFNPKYKLPAVITSIQPPVRVDRGHTPSPSSTITKVLFDFLATLPPNSSFVATPNVAFANAAAIPEHDYVTNPAPCYAGPNPPPCPAPSPIAQALTVGNITWDTASCDNYFQANWTNSGESITGYQTLDFRVSRQIDQIRNSSAATNFQIQFIAANGSPTGVALSLNKYFSLAGPVGLDDGSPDGFLHPILQTVRIPLSDFTGANLSNVRGVRFVFSDTPQGAIYLANIRLSNQP